jgi:hypothetical protein
MLLRRHPSVLVLSTAQALYWSCSIIGITLTSLVGRSLAPLPWMATLPLALLVAGTLLAVGPTARWMQALGRRTALRRGALLGLLGGLVSAAGLALGSFVLFTLGCMLVGGYQASAGFYRFAALDVVDTAHKGRAAAWVVAGGMLAALVAPWLALQTRAALPTPMMGAYLCIAALAGLAWALLGWLPQPKPSVPQAALQTKPNTTSPATTRRALWQRPALRMALLVTACGHGLMILVMNATPLAMDGCGHAQATSASVIQWHVLGMFAPSLLAGPAIDRWGAQRMAWAGWALLAASAIWAQAGVGAAHFLVSSLLLGAGWNCLLLAGTTLLSQSHTPEERSVAQPMMEWTNSAVAAAMSFAAGLLIQTLGWQAIQVAMLGVLACMAWWLRPRRQGPAQPLAAQGK